MKIAIFQHDYGGGRPRLRRTGARDHRRRAGRPRADHVRQEELAGPACRPHSPAHAARTARLPGGQLQSDPALQPSGSRRRIRHHGAGGVPADVRHQHHLRGHRADRNRHGEGRRAGNPPQAGNARRPDRSGRRGAPRQGSQGDVPQRPGLRHAPGRQGGSPRPGHGDGGRGVWRHVLRDCRRRRRSGLRSRPTKAAKSSGSPR